MTALAVALLLATVAVLIGVWVADELNRKDF